MQNMQKATNKTKVSEKNPTKATVFCVQNFTRVVKLFVLHVTLFFHPKSFLLKKKKTDLKLSR